MHPTVALFARNAWATERLLNWCSWQRPEVLAAGGEDVYGAIEPALVHLLGAEARYLRLLTGELPPGAVSERSPAPLAQLPAALAALEAAWRDVLASSRDLEELRRHERGGGQVEMPDWLPLLQNVHHGDDHRAQVGTLLGRQGVLTLEIDGWSFGFMGDERGLTRPAWADALLERAVAYHLWATDRQLEFAATLNAEQLALTAPGTFGSVLDTLRHLVESDRGYLSRLRSAGRGAELEPELGAVAGAWSGQAEAWRRYLDGRPDPEATVECSDGWYPGWVLVLQALHHGNDHRTHLGTVLLHHGIAAPDLDVWAYAEAEGVLRELA